MGLSWLRQKYRELTCKSDVHVTYKQKITGNKLTNVLGKVGAFFKNASAMPVAA